MTGFKQICDKAPLTLNADHSSSICDAAITRLNIKQTALRHLDLMQVTALEDVAISASNAAERHLRIQGAAALKQVTLAGNPANNWVIHLDLPHFPHGLQLSGPISQLDMCWLKDNELLTLAQKPKQALWQEVHFYDLNQMMVTDFGLLQDISAPALLIFSGSFQQAMAPVFANLPSLLFTDIAGIDALTLAGCHELTVQRAVGLRSIALLDDALQYLQLQQCPQFSQLRGVASSSAAHAQLTDAAHGDVELAGHWQSVKLRRSTLTMLTADKIEQLHITDCPHLTKLRAGSPLIFSSGVFAPELLDQASFSINESMIRETLQKLTVQMDHELIDALLQQAIQQFKPYNVCHAIMLLHALATLGYDIAKLWELRSILYVKNRRRQLHFRQGSADITPQSWHWTIKADRLFESLEADFLLWLNAYRSDITEAGSFMQAMVRSALVDQPAGFFTLCTIISRDDSPLTATEKLDFIHLLTEQKLAQTHTWLNLNEKLCPGLSRLSHFFITLCSAPKLAADTAISSTVKSNGLTMALFEFLLISLSPKLLSGILPAAMQTFPEHVRPRLLAMAHDSKLPYITKFADTCYDSVKVWYTKAALAKAQVSELS